MKNEIKNAILKMLSDEAPVTELCYTAEDFTWVFDYVKSNAEQAIFFFIRQFTLLHNLLKPQLPKRYSYSEYHFLFNRIVIKIPIHLKLYIKALVFILMNYHLIHKHSEIYI